MRTAFRTLIISLLALLLPITLMGCDSSTAEGDGGGASADCGADIQGSVYSFDEGTATLSGTITLPPGTADGLTINLMVAEENSLGNYGVVPAFLGGMFGGESDGCLSEWKTDGPTFTYEITDLNAGSYQLHLKLVDGETDVYDQTSETTIVVADDDVLTHDEAFTE
ncbi:MAG: hypothetical protein ACPGU1_19450 [Myxococcota bacterium]